MRDAKGYPNTIESVAEKLFNVCEVDLHDAYDINGDYRKWETLDKHIKEFTKLEVITVLNAVNYFEGKTCSDCGYFDPDEHTCFGED